MPRPTYSTATPTELQRWFDNGDKTAGQWLALLDDDLRHMRDAANSEIEDSAFWQDKPRPRWLGLHFSDTLLVLACFAALLVLVGAFWAAPLVALVREWR